MTIDVSSERGMNQQERTVLIAQLSCPICGLPLAGAAGDF